MSKVDKSRKKSKSILFGGPDVVTRRIKNGNLELGIVEGRAEVREGRAI